MPTVCFAQGNSVTSFGRLPSSRLRPAGSFTPDTDAVLKARHKIIVELAVALMSWTTSLLRHARPWSPRTLTALPHTHTVCDYCGRQALYSYAPVCVPQLLALPRRYESFRGYLRSKLKVVKNRAEFRTFLPSHRIPSLVKLLSTLSPRL